MRAIQNINGRRGGGEGEEKKWNYSFSFYPARFGSENIYICLIICEIISVICGSSFNNERTLPKLTRRVC